MCSVSCRENMRGTNLSLCKQQEAQGSWLMSRGTSEYGSACTCERVHTYKRMKHLHITFPPSYMGAGIERLNWLCCNKSWVLYVFVFTSLVMAKIKMKRKLKSKQKTYKNTQHSILHLADGQYIFSVFVVLFVTSMWHHYLFCWCVEVVLWVPGSGPAPSCQLHSIP